MNKPFFRLSFVIIALLSWSPVQSSEISVLWSNDILTVGINGIEYPERLDRELGSGLTTKFLINVSALSNSKPVFRQTFDLWIKFDLWDEDYTLTLKSGANVVTEVQLSSKATVMQNLNQISLPLVGTRDMLSKYESFLLNADIILNPIKKEKLKKIKKWVASNNITGRVNVGIANTSGPRASNMFNYIVEHNDLGENVAASWRKTIQSSRFVTEIFLGE